MKNIRATVPAMLAAALAVLLAGCSSSTHEPTELQKLSRNLVRPEKVWSVNVGEGFTGFLQPAATIEGVFAAGGDDLYCLDAATGDRRWKVEADAEITAGVGSDGRYVAVGTAAGEVEVFDAADGSRLWKERLSGEVTEPPLVGSGFVIVRTADTRVTAFDAATGERRWRYQGQIPSLTLHVPKKMCFSPAGVLVGQHNGRMAAFDPQGRVVFDMVVSQPSGITEVERLIDVVGSPYVDSNMMCAATFQGGITCISSQNGRLIWRNKVDAVAGPVSDGTSFYIPTAKGEVKSFDYQTGREVWSNSDLVWRDPSGAVRFGEWVAVGDFDGYIHIFDPYSGEIVGRTSLSGPIKVAPVMLGIGAVFQTTEGQVSFILPGSSD